LRGVETNLERPVYSTPDYSLRFAAHCRSRLKYLEGSALHVARGPAVAGSPRFWIRFAPHEPRASLTGKCATHRAQGDAR
jgi:hypothetical protein